MAIKFSDLAKAPTDILNEDYTSKVSLKCKKNAGPVAVTIETERAARGTLTSKVGTKFSYAGLNFDKVQHTADGGSVLETSLVPAPGFKLSFKGGRGAVLGLDYKKSNFVATGKMDVKDMSKFSTSACLGLSGGVTVGSELAYALSGKTGVTSFNVGASYSAGSFFAAAATASKFSQLNVDCMYKVNPDLSIAGSTTHSAAESINLVAVGCAYKAPLGDIKAKVGSNGVLSAVLVKNIAPKVALTASGSIKGTDTSTFKYGLGLSL
eukprot:CAMPEP_0197826406 /NCGR_PEP_ID=MMETSP1437-20131217/3364_1 /TAXON_ID=49252 ORGANISM="Eucampia antarctica, Strain CCMP1452" /NCGR_SAMPLE_ID=MMETSP1437 /ASSEMBLY_ACC=CAM_ASM_001096 /LENGTH=265 /DNA_ID=CAMNT_0043426829 /DNA_START=49 /DNA_END=846 /DNA_ORIENTATION=-